MINLFFIIQNRSRENAMFFFFAQELKNNDEYIKI